MSEEPKKTLVWKYKPKVSSHSDVSIWTAPSVTKDAAGKIRIWRIMCDNEGYFSVHDSDYAREASQIGRYTTLLMAMRWCQEAEHRLTALEPLAPVRTIEQLLLQWETFPNEYLDMRVVVEYVRKMEDELVKLKQDQFNQSQTVRRKIWDAISNLEAAIHQVTEFAQSLDKTEGEAE